VDNCPDRICKALSFAGGLFSQKRGQRRDRLQQLGFSLREAFLLSFDLGQFQSSLLNCLQELVGRAHSVLPGAASNSKSVTAD